MNFLHIQKQFILDIKENHYCTKSHLSLRKSYSQLHKLVITAPYNNP
jgi:hypothetical protein